MNDLLELLTMLAVPVSVLLFCRYLNRRDAVAIGSSLVPTTVGGSS